MDVTFGVGVKDDYLELVAESLGDCSKLIRMESNEFLRRAAGPSGSLVLMSNPPGSDDEGDVRLRIYLYGNKQPQHENAASGVTDQEAQ